MENKKSDFSSKKFDDYYAGEAELIFSEEEEKREVLVQNKVSWDKYVEAPFTEKDIELIKKYEKNKAKILLNKGPDCVRILLISLVRFNKDDELKYVVTLLEDILKMKENNPDLEDGWKWFYALNDSQPLDNIKLPFGPLLTIVRRKQKIPYIISKACTVLTNLLLHFPEVPAEVVDETFSWYITQLKEKRDDEKDDQSKERKEFDRKISTVLITLRPLLKVNRYRIKFADDHGLSPLIKWSFPSDKESATNFQLIYEAVYCLWLLSFNAQVKLNMTDPKLIKNLCFMVKRVNKEKVIRITLATLRNLLSVGKNNELMITFGLVKTVQLLSPKKWGDEDIDEDLKTLEEVLSKNVDDLSSWDRYKNEVLSQKLEWTPPHKSEKFWAENYLRFEEDNCYVLKCLKEILESVDKLSLAIACWDIGEFVRFHPGGKRVVANLEIKIPIMKLLNHPDNDVSKEALLALQKLMITNWEYLQK